MIARSLIVLSVVGAAALVSSFLPQRLAVPEGAVAALPSITPPPGLRIGVIETGTMRSQALFAYRGGNLATRELAMDVVLVDHPQGRLLIDTGLGTRVAEHLKTVPLLLRTVASLSPQTPARPQLEALGYPPSSLKGVVLTHAHWDHVSGLDDLREVPVWVSERERAFICV